MHTFQITHPTTVQAVLHLLKQPDHQIIAGGQTLIVAMKQGLAQPKNLVNILNISELKHISIKNDSLCIGSTTTHQEVERSELVKSHIPALASLAGHIGDRQIRSMGTLGGVLANNDPSACYPSAVLALNANIHTAKGLKIRSDDYFQGIYQTTLEPEDFIVEVSFPIPKKAVYLKFSQSASRFALVGVFLALTNEGVRLAVTGASMRGVYREKILEEALNKNFTIRALDHIELDTSQLNEDIHGSARYRANLIKVLTKRAIQQLET